MIVRCVLGLLTPVAGLSLHKGSQVVQQCEGNDCHMTVPVRDPIQCECCWRDCDFHEEETQEMQAEGGEVEVVPLDIRDDVDAWIIANAPELKGKEEWNRYTPILETVKVAVESQGSVAAIIGPANNDLRGMVEGVKGAVSKGRRPLVFTVAHEWWWKNIGYALDILKQAKDAGAYLVSYQAEPGTGYGEHGTLAGEIQKKALNMSAQMGADEIWEYTYANMNYYATQPDIPILRYVPPGYVQKLDVGVDLNSRHTNASMVGYMGNNHLKPMNGLYRGLLAGRINETNHVWSPDDLRTYLETYPIQLNQHRWQTCCPREKWEAEMQHFEAFRMSSLLANKVCVISGPSADRDMEVWKGMVTFAEVEDTVAAIEKLRLNLQVCRQNSYEMYKRVFQPAALLTKSGFFKAWRPPHGI